MKRLFRFSGIWALVSLVVLCAATVALRPADWMPRTQHERLTHTIHSYRQWQSTGVRVQTGDHVVIRAEGEWQYSPVVGLHGPRGGLPSGPRYPVPGALGGALLARVGENTNPFVVGPYASFRAPNSGFIFLRINDDLLGDNEGSLEVTIAVTPAEATPGP